MPSRKRSSRGRAERIKRGLQAQLAVHTALLAAYTTARPVSQKDDNTANLPLATSSSSDSRKSVDSRRVQDVGMSGTRGTIDSFGEFHYQPLEFDSHSRPFHHHHDDDGTHLYVSSEDDLDTEEQLEAFQAKWEAGRMSTPVSSNSRGGVEMVSSTDSKGKGKAVDADADPDERKDEPAGRRPHGRKKTRNDDKPMQWTQQRPPFHTSTVGKLASRSPHSIGIFKPGYPFLPSGRRRPSELERSWRKADLVASAYTTHHPSIMHSNIMKHGWTKLILDDDNRLSVPDERRRSRVDSVPRVTKSLWGKKMFRWKAGEGYVWSRKKDLSPFEHGPGIALGQLLPPKGQTYTSALPLIPNDSKRDLVWMIILSIALFSLIAFVKEYLTRSRSNRKGKGRSWAMPPLTRRQNNTPGVGRRKIRVSPLVTSAGFGQRRTRRRMEAQNFRDLCKTALLKGVSTMSATTSSGLANIRWTSASGVNSSSSTTSSSYNAGCATRRIGLAPLLFHQIDGQEGATIELLEKGGVDSSGVVSPAVDGGHFDCSAILTTVSTIPSQQSPFCDLATPDRPRTSRSSESGASATGSSSSSSSNTHSHPVQAL